MRPLLIIIGIALATFAILHLRRLAREKRFRQLAGTPLNSELVNRLRPHMPLYDCLPPALQRQLQGLINVFLNDKRFQGAGGLAVTDEMRLTVAGNACLLLLNRSDPCFPRVKTILLYPDTLITHQVQQDGPIVHEGPSARLGESWHRGPVILSWADVLRGVNNPNDGHNVVLHEFAHKLDEENGSMNGLPILREHTDYPDWARIMSTEFAHLTEQINHNDSRNRQRNRSRNSVIDEYGGASPAEFFAVATEAFFEEGQKMRKRLPELYAQLKQYYGVDPAKWQPRRDVNSAP